MKDGITSVVLLHMKTTISLPDDLFRLAERAARQLKMSRSQLYAAALSEFLERRQTKRVTGRLNAIYSQEPAKVDLALHCGQLNSLSNNP
jgi:metal-responsive CopG/Arc/MetJ family transcriptional regulator